MSVVWFFVMEKLDPYAGTLEKYRNSATKYTGTSFGYVQVQQRISGASADTGLQVR